MIADRTVAAKLFKAAYEAYVGVHNGLMLVISDLSLDERNSCKHAVGKVMGEILFELTEPILKQHPDLIPDDWREADAKPDFDRRSRSYPPNSEAGA